METTIYQDGNYTVTGNADGRTYRVTISNGAKSQGVNFFPLDAAGKTEILRNLPSGMVAQLKKMNANPAEYAICNGILIRMAAVAAIESAVAAWQASGEIPAPPAEVFHCERCGDRIEGQPIFRKGKVAGITVHDPLCATCAKLLRIAAGGIGVAGESFSPSDHDGTPYTKGDF